MLNNDFSQPIEPTVFTKKKPLETLVTFSFLFIQLYCCINTYVFPIATAFHLNYKDDILLYDGCQSLYLQVFLSCSGQMRTGIFYETHSLKVD